MSCGEETYLKHLISHGKQTTKMNLLSLQDKFNAKMQQWCTQCLGFWCLYISESWLTFCPGIRFQMERDTPPKDHCQRPCQTRPPAACKHCIKPALLAKLQAGFMSMHDYEAMLWCTHVRMQVYIETAYRLSLYDRKAQSGTIMPQGFRHWQSYYSEFSL